MHAGDVLGFLLTAGAVFFLAFVIHDVLGKAYAEYRERYVGKAARELGDMFLFVQPSQLLALTVASVLVLVGVAFLLAGGWSFKGWLAMAAAAALGAVLPRWFVSHYRKRRLERFNRQLVDALVAMSNAFRAGLNLPQAMDYIATEAPAPLSQEFGLCVKEVKLGVSLDEAMESMARRVGSEDLELVTTSATISRQMGGNLAEIFETISSTIRERFRLEGKIKSLTAQGKLQGRIVGAMPLLLGVVFYYMRPDLMGPMLDHWFGAVLIGIICAMEAMGIILIRKIVQIDI